MVHIPNSSQPLNQSALTLKLNASLADLKLQVGQTLNIQVERVQPQQAQLTIGNLSLTASHKMTALSPGTLQVQVKQLQPTLVLSVPVSASQNALTANPQNALLQSTYSRLIGHQMPLPQALQQMSQISALPPAVQSLLWPLLESTLKPNSALDGVRLQKHLINSGLFLENKLRQGSDQASIKADRKAQLLQLQQAALTALTQTPEDRSLKQLLRLLHVALNKLQIQQLQLFEHPMLISLDLPMEKDRQIENLQMQFHRKKTAQLTQWEVMIQMQIEGQALQANLILQTEPMSLQCQIWCESTELQQRLMPYLDTLQTRLEHLDLPIRPIELVKIKPEITPFSTQVAIIDIKV
jgi:hypothetical protein